MHSMDVEGWIVHHNGDFSGEVELHAPGFPTGVTRVPFVVLQGIVAEAVRQRRISELEDMHPTDILGMGLHR